MPRVKKNSSTFTMKHLLQGLYVAEWTLLSVFNSISYVIKCFAHLQLLLRCIAIVRFYARKQNASRVFAIVWASVCLSVRPSVTVVSCIKTVQARITKFSPWTATRSLVYRDKISCHWVQGFPSNEGVEEGYPP